MILPYDDRGDPTWAIPLYAAFYATFDGIRTVWEKVEHYNEGPGWCCMEVDQRAGHRMLPSGVYSSRKLSNVERIP